MAKRLKNIIVNPITGKVEFRFPLELTPESQESLKDLININGYEVGIAKLGYRTFPAAMIPMSEEQYHELIKDELNNQDIGITPHIKGRKVRCLYGFPAFCLLFELLLG